MSIRGGPVPTDIGRANWGDSAVELGVDAIGKHSQSYNCGGWGHASRECPSDRGAQGSTAKGKGKGLDKGAGRVAREAVKGKGKGYQGACYTCSLGSAGPAMVMSLKEESDEGEMQEKVFDVGTIWNVEVMALMVSSAHEKVPDHFGLGCWCWLFAS